MVPFWFLNLAPALAGMRLLPYAAATFLGIIPATVVFAGIGAGLGQVFDAGGQAGSLRHLLAGHPAAAARPGGAVAGRRLVARPVAPCRMNGD